jgi:hypothetical protein
MLCQQLLLCCANNHVQDNASFINIPYWSDNVTEVFALTILSEQLCLSTSTRSVGMASKSKVKMFMKYGATGCVGWLMGGFCSPMHLT